VSYGIPTVAVDGVPDPLPEGLHVLDVREPEEWRHGHIAGALHIPLRDLPAGVGDLPDGEMLVVCRVGARSAQAVAYLQRLGHDAVNLGGGMVAWEDAERPMVSETGTPPLVV
jgi:rhodanese-related sulfurtransferase